MLMIQKFLVQIEDTESTRWLANPEQVRDRLAALAQRITGVMTDGPRPRISVVREEVTEIENLPGDQRCTSEHGRAYSGGRGESVTRSDQWRRELAAQKPVSTARPPARIHGAVGDPHA